MSEEQLKLELNKIALTQAEHDADLRHKWEQESHEKFQRWFWVGTVILLALGNNILYYQLLLETNLWQW